MLQTGVPTVVVIPLPQSYEENAFSRKSNGHLDNQTPGYRAVENMEKITCPDSVQLRASLEDRKQSLLGQFIDSTDAECNFEVMSK